MKKLILLAAISLFSSGYTMADSVSDEELIIKHVKSFDDRGLCGLYMKANMRDLFWLKNVAQEEMDNRKISIHNSEECLAGYKDENP